MGFLTKDWIDSAQDIDYWGALVNVELNLRVPYTMESVTISVILICSHAPMSYFHVLNFPRFIDICPYKHLITHLHFYCSLSSSFPWDICWECDNLAVKLAKWTLASWNCSTGDKAGHWLSSYCCLKSMFLSLHAFNSSSLKHSRNLKSYRTLYWLTDIRLSHGTTGHEGKDLLEIWWPSIVNWIEGSRFEFLALTGVYIYYSVIIGICKGLWQWCLIS